MTESALNAWIMAARPKTLWAAVAPVLIGTALAFGVGGLHVTAAVAALLGALLIQVGTNYANDYFDFKKGADQHDRLGPTRATQAGLVTPTAMKRATMLVFSAALLCGIYLVWLGGWPIVIVGLFSILFGILYTAGPYPLAYNGLGEIFVLIFFGPVAVGGTFYVQTLDINNAALIAGVAPGLYSVAILAVNNLRDIESDRVSHKKTLAVRFGLSFARAEYLSAILFASAIPLIIYFVFSAHPGILAATIVPIIFIRTIYSVMFGLSGRALNEVLAATGKMLLLYAVLFSVGLIL